MIVLDYMEMKYQTIVEILDLLKDDPSSMKIQINQAELYKLSEIKLPNGTILPALEVEVGPLHSWDGLVSKAEALSYFKIFLDNSNTENPNSKYIDALNVFYYNKFGCDCILVSPYDVTLSCPSGENTEMNQLYTLLKNKGIKVSKSVVYLEKNPTLKKDSLIKEGDS
jgi:hypothetical protein